MARQLLIEKYRSKNIAEYLFQDSEVERKVMKWIEEQEIPNILLSGSAGTGKTTLSKVLVKELDIDSSDVLYANASLDSGIGFIRETIEPWLKRASFSTVKVVQFEEADRLSKDAQQALRNLIEEYQNVRWIFTCNYPKQIIEPIHSRLQHIQLDSLNEEGILDHIADIIDAEGLTFEEEDDVLSHITSYSPDMRKIINSIDEHTDLEKRIHPVTKTSSGGDVEKWEEIWASSGTSLDLDAAMSLVGMIDQSNFDWFYEVMYENHRKFPNTAEGIVLVSKYLDRAQTQANQPLHLHACLYEIFVLNQE